MLSISWKIQIFQGTLFLIVKKTQKQTKAPNWNSNKKNTTVFRFSSSMHHHHHPLVLFLMSPWKFPTLTVTKLPCLIHPISGIISFPWLERQVNEKASNCLLLIKATGKISVNILLWPIYSTGLFLTRTLNFGRRTLVGLWSCRLKRNVLWWPWLNVERNKVRLAAGIRKRQRLHTLRQMAIQAHLQ